MLPAVWASIIFATSCTVIHSRAFVSTVSDHLPIDHAPKVFASFWEGWWWVFVKGYHAMEFAVLFLLVRLWLRSVGVRRFTLWAFVGSVAYAASDEFHQTFVPGRGGHVTDVLIDSGGVLVASLMVLGLGAIRAKRS